MSEQKPVAEIVRNAACQITMRCPDGSPFDMSQFVGSMLYAAPPAQPAYCHLCHADDMQAPCAYPEGGRRGCLRDQRLAAQPAQAQPADTVRLAATRVGRVYLAGPMTGYAEFNFPTFNAAAAALRAEGWSVVNPADHGLVDGAGWGDYLRHDIAKIAGCESIALLPGWSKSKGAQLEVHIANALEMPIRYLDGAEPAQAQPARLSDDLIVHLWDTRVGDLCDEYPLTNGDIKNFARAIVAAVVPPGFVVVPEEPTEAMCKAGDDCQDSDPSMDDSPSYYTWRAMIAAAKATK